MRIGVDLGGTKIEAVVLGDEGEIVTRRRRPTPRESYADLLRAIVELVEDLESEVGERASVGVATPGAISPHTGLVKNANSTRLIGERLDADLSDALDRRIRVANDANCFALSEAVDGAAKGARTVFGVILGTGVGGGIVIEGRVIAGRQAIAGEWGHNPLPWPRASELPGLRCYCGRHGCIETFLSGPGLERDYREGSEAASSAAEIVRLAASGEQRAEACLIRYEHRLARGLAHVINILDPDVIVLGGGLSAITRLYESVPRLWGEFVFSDRVDTPLRPPVHGDASGVRGAAWLWPRGA
ncbi:MAG: ROK family protein [Gammaproteobacteria bacterium]|nr:ROK family protein [Gammaproteobacteria bacterium]NIM72783.1 ROK family protein [Gammaproteobacteria bacterium]NIN38240.1 ROK family protein [Gammaproteobacteria bacterium]NIO24531.1 ROK family protein [Gammaproteobacteria bacterium]NIO65140.1 ROK family protein [Gammaproteobacteria bacterium]